MSNLLIISFEDIPTSNIIQAFCSGFSFPTRFLLEKNIKQSDFEWADVIMIVRGNDKLSLKVARKVKKANKCLLLYLDDDLIDDSRIDKHNKLFVQNNACVKKILSMCDRLIVCNEYLGKKYQHYTNKEYGLLLTPVYDYEIKKIDFKKEDEPIKIIYPAHKSHKMWFEKYVLPGLSALSYKYKDKLSFTSIGLDLDLSSCSKEMHITKLPHMNYEEYCCYMKENNFDIGVAPIDETEFSKCKYYNKFIEYAKYGIAGIYSDSIPYTQIVEEKENGLLAKSDSSEWEKMMEYLIENKDICKKIKVNSQNTLRTKLNINFVEKRFLESVPEVKSYSYSGKRTNIGKMYLWDFYYRVRRRLMLLMK